MKIRDLLVYVFGVFVSSADALTTPTISTLEAFIPRGSVADHAAQAELKRLESDVETVIKNLRPTENDPSISGVFSSCKLSFSNIYSKEMWDAHTSRWRYVRHFIQWPRSTLLHRILPQFSILIAWSLVCSQYAQPRHWVLPQTPLSLLSTFVAFLLTLRSNQGLSRLSQGRLAFGSVVLHTRDFAHLLSAYVMPFDPVLGLMMARHVSVFGWTLKGQIRQSDESDIVKTMLCPNDAAFVLMRRKPAVAIVQRLRQSVADLASRNLLCNPQHNALERTLSDLHSVITVCERIQASPIPSEYTAHTSRLLLIYLFLLPLAVGEMSVMVTTLVGFAMLGLDEISHFLEEPFRLMPLHQLSKNSMLDVTDAMMLPPTQLPREFSDQDDSVQVRHRPSYW